MVRVQSLGKPFGDKLYNALRAVFTDICTDIYVIEHGSRLRINLTNVRGDSVDINKAISVINPIINKEPYNQFDGGTWCSFYYS